jgi:hypothetical protein
MKRAPRDVLDRPEAVLAAEQQLAARITALAPLCNPTECLRIHQEFALMQTTLDILEHGVRARTLYDAKRAKALPTARRVVTTHASKKRRKALPPFRGGRISKRRTA